MNTKRQTIWLITMLSLMVVLSAYYLFTNDIDDTADMAADAGWTEQDGTESEAGGVIVNDTTQQGDFTLSAADQDILKKLEAEDFANGGLFTDILKERDESTRELNDRAMAAIAQTQSNPEEAAAASAELEALETRYEKIRELEEEFKESYDMALIEDKNDRLKVVVTSDKLEKKQAAAIIDRVMNVLEVEASQVSVQYVQ